MTDKGSEGTILLVDDTPATIEFMKTALEENGYQVLVATSGEKAITRAALTLPDLILLDIRMPGMTGYDTCLRLKANIITATIPIIFMSALTDTFDKVKGFAMGAVDYMVKPVETEELFARVRTHLTVSRLQKALEASNTRLEERILARTEELHQANARLQEEIAERRQAEKEVRHLNAALEQRVQQRTAELEAANQELKEFAHIVSHDLKAPLRGINQLADWFATDYADVLDDPGQEMLELLSSRVTRLDNLISGILEYSRAGNIEEQTEQIELNTLVNNVIDLIAPSASIQITVSADLPCVVGNAARLTQVFQNLLSNAVKFMDKPEGKIRIDCVDGGTYWQFRVLDNGPGIEAKHQEKIFQIFQTLQSRDERENTGIGLALVKKIVRLYGGHIWVESEPGKGSAFCFTLAKT